MSANATPLLFSLALQPLAGHVLTCRLSERVLDGNLSDAVGLIDHLTVYSCYRFSDITRDRLHQLHRLWWRGGRHSAGSGEVDVSLEAIGPPEAIPGSIVLGRSALFGLGLFITERSNG